MSSTQTPTIDGTCRITVHGYTDLIMPDYDGKWDYVLSDRIPPAWATDYKTLFELTQTKRDKKSGAPIEAYQLLVLEPDILGQYAWGGNRALVCEHLDLATNRHWFSFSLGVTDPDGMFAPDTVINSAVVRGSGRYADISGEYLPDERTWVFSELIYEETPTGRSKTASWKDTQDLVMCDFPAWVKDRLTKVFLPKLQSWFDRLPENKANKKPMPTHLTNHPTGNPHLDWKSWSEYMKVTVYVCTTCAGEVGFRKARKATFIKAAPRQRYGVECLCDEHRPQTA